MGLQVRQEFLVPGFIDTHIHLPQFPYTGAGIESRPCPQSAFSLGSYETDGIGFGGYLLGGVSGLELRVSDNHGFQWDVSIVTR